MTTSIQPWRVLSRELDYKKYSRKIEKVVFELPSTEQADFYLKQEGPAVCVLALTKDQRVILCQQFRPGPAMILNELPGGFVDGGETPEDAARRELLEETGYTGEFQFVTTCLDDAYSSMKRYCFVALDCHHVQEPHYDEHEQGTVVLNSLEDFRNLLRSGQCTDVEVGYLGLDYLNKLHQI